MKNRLLSIMLIIAIAIGVFAGVCLVADAEEGESPNLLEMYGYNPNFNDGIAPWRTSTSATIEQSDEDSSDGDGYCAKISNRHVNFSVPRLMGDDCLKIFEEQGAGDYYYAFSVKCVKKSGVAKIRPLFQLVYGGTNYVAGETPGAWPSGTLGNGGVEVKNEWVRIETTITVDTVKDGKTLAAAIIYSSEVDWDTGMKTDLYFDDIVLIKKTGGWKNVTPEPEVEVPSQTRVDAVTRPEKTGVGAIYYHNWFETIDSWWTMTNDEIKATDKNSAQEARCLAPNKHHYRLPFFATINTSITQAGRINGDVSTGVPEFPVFTEEIWRQEIDYAVDAGIDFMAYLWANPKRLSSGAWQYHVNTKGADGKMKMCGIIQTEDTDFNSLAAAMTEDFYYTIDGMPVVYIYDAATVATEELITKVRKKLAIAQYVKNGEVGAPAYIIAMGMSTYQSAVGVTARGIDAVSWYSVGATSAVNDEIKKQWKTAGISDDALTIKSFDYKYLASYGLDMMKNVSKVWEKGYASVSPIITLGRNPLPRIENPVTWSTGSSKALPYQGTYAKDPTPEQMTQNVLDVLNFNKENGFSCNTVIMYCWNEFDEGGWCCPTLLVDKEGNAIKDANGNYQANTEYLEAVKKGIALYREHEAEDAIYDIDGNKIKDIVQTTPQPAKTQKPGKTSAPTEAPSSEEEIENNNSWVLWAIIGGVIVAAATAVVVIILKKKKTAANSAE